MSESVPNQNSGHAAAPSLLLAMTGLGPLTPVETDWGQFPAQALRVRDRVRVRSGAYRPITFVDHVLLDEDFLVRNEEAQPVQVQTGRLGYAMPNQPVLLAPGQKLAIGHGFGGTYQTAHELLEVGMAYRRPERFLTYVVFGFDEPELVNCAGLWACVEPRASMTDDDAD